MNIAISIITTILVIIALQKGIPEVLMIFGAWALLTGLIQLVLGLRRRKVMDGQWPMILSGGQSMLAGVVIFAMAHSPNQGISNLAGYSLVGAVYFLIAAIRLGKMIKSAPLIA